MMQTHRDIFIKVLVVTVVIGILYFISFGCTIINGICLALFGSAVIATFLEFVNYLSAKRQLIMQIIADNAYISDAITDSVWFYNNCGDYVKKLNELISLYKILQSYSFCLSREAYFPLISKDSFIKTLKENVDAIVGIYNLILKIQRTIVSFRNVRTNFRFEGKVPENIEQIMDKQPAELIVDDIKKLKEFENTILECNKKYREKYKLGNYSRMKNHGEILEEIVIKVEEQQKNYK